MAANILKQTRAVGYFPTMRSVVSHLRCPLMSGIATASNVNQSPHYVTNQDLGPFATKDPRFPLPGNMNYDVKMHSETFQTPENQQSLASVFLDVETNEMKKRHVFAQFINNTEIDDKKKAQEIKNCNSKEMFENAKGKVECSVQKCTASLQRSFSDLFPDRNFKTGEMTVVSICQHTKNDMTVWSQDVDEEREELLKNFIESASEICDLLKSKGYWADFIDPSSGNAYFGPYSNSTFFETDERYNQLGYRVLDLGCCKALSHHVWGTYIYVGSIFTNAPADSLSLHTVLSTKD
ncbi:methylmalonic aciduria and homocystinuria type D homolog, mitochondrial-like [Dendronephthya gigantea]|uniref:methylmalonic aciduria and homocystinuria type D homolog, mitochondrial-like n=1 Tax=Dendronephthya gigantea TaxID=151771 RepID=UPI00106D04D6|nr:methylmalonic aciduria and homocystinuria type D homolog, mitochondrial-like [Dendronephthya gigantea]XP_028392583.1 methylmalonic aciduria and homocystinuria type D homolog, mitochondrial-like [Dendronephthya gigantea]